MVGSSEGLGPQVTEGEGEIESRSSPSVNSVEGDERGEEGEEGSISLTSSLP